jgi:hypothetical protein
MEIHKSCAGNKNVLLHSSGYALKEIEERYSFFTLLGRRHSFHGLNRDLSPGFGTGTGTHIRHL